MADDHSRNAELDNYANQKNPNHIAFWKSRGFHSRPDRWEDFIIWAKIYEKSLDYETLKLFEVCDGSYDEDIPTLSSKGQRSRDAARNNRANQRNPNNPVFWKSRCFEERPVDWKDFIIWTQIEMRPINLCTYMEFSNIRRLDNDGGISTAAVVGVAAVGIAALVVGGVWALFGNNEEKAKKMEKKEKNGN